MVLNAESVIFIDLYCLYLKQLPLVDMYQGLILKHIEDTHKCTDHNKWYSESLKQGKWKTYYSICFHTDHKYLIIWPQSRPIYLAIPTIPQIPFYFDIHKYLFTLTTTNNLLLWQPQITFYFANHKQPFTLTTTNTFLLWQPQNTFTLTATTTILPW